MVHTRSPRDAARAHERMVAHGAAHAAPAHVETAHDGETLRALMFLQNRPRTSPELQRSTNTISPSLKPSHLTP